MAYDKIKRDILTTMIAPKFALWFMDFISYNFGSGWQTFLCEPTIRSDLMGIIPHFIVIIDDDEHAMLFKLAYE
jgi:hypothetical protein